MKLDDSRPCPECHGTGLVTGEGLTGAGDPRCFYCRGRGRLYYSLMMLDDWLWEAFKTAVTWSLGLTERCYVRFCRYGDHFIHEDYRNPVRWCQDPRPKRYGHVLGCQQCVPAQTAHFTHRMPNAKSTSR